MKFERKFILQQFGSYLVETCVCVYVCAYMYVYVLYWTPWIQMSTCSSLRGQSVTLLQRLLGSKSWQKHWCENPMSRCDLLVLTCNDNKVFRLWPADMKLVITAVKSIFEPTDVTVKRLWLILNPTGALYDFYIWITCQVMTCYLNKNKMKKEFSDHCDLWLGFKYTCGVVSVHTVNT